MRTNIKHFLRYLCVAALIPLTGCSNLPEKRAEPALPFQKDTEVLGTWWWWVDPKVEDKYLDFAAANGVNEIYYHTVDLNNRNAAVIEKAGKRGIKVFFLMSDYNDIWERRSFERLMARYLAFQKKMPEKRRFAGIHLDIEPQEHPRYPDNPVKFLQDYLDFVVWVCSKYRGESGVGTIDLDIAWWFNIELNYRGVKTPLYKALIDEADRVAVMSYMDTAEKTYEIAKEEIAYAKKRGKQILLGAETGQIKNEPEISFYGKGTAYFHEQLHKLHSLVNYDNYGLAIHYISAWYPMANQD